MRTHQPGSLRVTLPAPSTSDFVVTPQAARVQAPSMAASDAPPHAAQCVLASQQAFFATGQTRSPAFRSAQLKALRRLIIAQQTVLGRALKDDLGKAESEIVTGELGFVVREIARLLKGLQRWSRAEKVSTPLVLWPAKSRVLREPYGPVLVIGPWNVPLGLALVPALGALAAGNTVVLKPSEYAPNTASALERLVNDNFASEYFHVVRGDETALELSSLPFSYVFFTGGAEVGRQVYRAAAEHLCPVTLELGGKNPCIVRADANVPVAARRIALGKFYNAGQTCVAPDIVFVPTSLKAPLVEALGTALDAFYGADPRRSEDYGRIVNVRHFGRLMSLLEGANVCRGGQTDATELYFAPTLVDGVDWATRLGSEEIFGPILPIVGYESESELTALLFRMPRPLALYVFTEDHKAAAAWRVRHPSGALGLNDAGSHVMNPELPFGGVGASGLGSYRGDETWRTFTRPLAVLERSTRMDLDLRYPPYSPRALAAMKKVLDPPND
ncbi:MAG TPA: aldehyde dehydrogenase family protein [Polyangiaceae bacterium]|nr:aldehyde dehydrogenase family protein [Polyangiaceae bacterium]